MTDATRTIDSARNARSRLWMIVAAIFVIYALTVAFAPVGSVLGRFMVDDSLYYYGIARHVAAGDGSVFDGINETNGYHPLWMLVLTPVYMVFGGDPYVGFHAALVVQALMLAGILWLLVSTGREIGLGETGLWAAMLLACSPLFFHLWINGLESSLLAVFILAALRQYVRVKSGRSDTLRGRLLLGVYCAGAFLARLDSVFFPVVIIAVEVVDAIVRRRWHANFLRSLAVGMMMLVIGGPYLLRNLLVFGHIMPVSGYMKTPGASGAEARFGVTTGGLFWPVGKLADELGVSMSVTGGLALALLLATGVLAVVAIRRRLRGTDASKPALAAFGVYLLTCLAHYAYVALAMPKFCNTMWYYIPAILGASLVAGYIVSAFTPERPGRAAAIACVALAVVLAGLGGWHRFTRPNSLYAAKLDVARWLEAAMTGKRGAAYDAGIVGYFSGGSVVNLDGLVNNLELKDYADAGRLDRYLLDKRVDYVVQHAATDGGGKRSAWLWEELGPVLGEKRYEKPFGPGGRMTMYVVEVRAD